MGWRRARSVEVTQYVLPEGLCMDPVQLMMAAHQADAAVAAQTPDQALQAAIAQSRPDLWAPLSTNPAAYPDLLGWLASTGNVEVLANLRARGYLTDDAAANAADAADAAVTAGGEPAVDPTVVQEGAMQTGSADDGAAPVYEGEAETADESEAVEESDSEPVESAESAAEAATQADAEAEAVEDAADEDQGSGSDEADGGAGDEPGTDPSAEPTEIDESADEAAGTDDDSGETGDDQRAEEPTEPTEDAEVDEAESQAPEGQDTEDATADEPADATEDPGSDESDDEITDSDAGESADEPEEDTPERQAAEDAVGDESAGEGSAEVAEAVETTEATESEAAAQADAEAEAAEDAADEDQGSGSDEPDDEGGDEPGADPSAEPTEVDEAADDSEDAADEAKNTASEGPDAEDVAKGDSGEATDSGDDVIAPADEEPKAEESTEAENIEPVDDDPTVLTPVSQWHEVDSADTTTDVMTSAQSAAVAAGWAADSAAPAAGSAESVALPVPPPPSAEDIAAWAETPSGAPSGFSAAQPAVELDMFGPQVAAQMPPPQQQKQPSKSSTGRLIAIIVVLLLVIAGGGGVWAGNYFANKGKGEDSSQDKAGANGDEGGKQNGQADAAATSTAAALPSGAVKACSSMPTFTITSVEDGQGELKVQGNMATSCTEGDFLAGSSNQVLVYSATSPTGGADVDHLVASGTFDLSSDPLIIPNGGRTVTLRFGEQHYFRTAKDLDLKGLSVRPSFDRGSPSSATSKSSTNSPMTIASSASSNANQETQDEQAAGDAIQWQVKHDYPIVMNSMRGKWTPQLSSKQVGLVADGQTWTNRSILAEFLKTRQSNPKAVIIDTGQWPVYDVSGWWVTLSGELYDDADKANGWCDAQGYDSDHCLAKRIESNGSPQGTTKTR